MRKMTNSFFRFSFKVMVLHTITYLIVGSISSYLNDYESLFKMPIVRDLMISFDSKWIMYGPLLQPVRGFVYAIVLWPFRPFILSKEKGWLYIWSLFIGFAIIGPTAASPGSMEGLIYTKLPLYFHFVGMPEMLSKTFAFSTLLFYWDKRSEIRNKN